MSISGTLLSELSIIAAATIAPAAIASLLAVSNLQKPKSKGDLLIFPVSRISKIAGLAVAAASAVATYFSATTKNADLWTSLFFCCLGWIGLWMSVGEFRLTSSGIEKRFLWRSKAIPWSQIREIDESSGGATLYSESAKFWVEPWYAGYGRLLREIHERAPHLKVREKSKWKKRLGW